MEAVEQIPWAALLQLKVALARRQIRVRLVIQPPMQVLPEPVVACHWAQALQRTGIVDQLSYQVDLLARAQEGIFPSQ
jgi:hypothetical protein